MTDCKMAENIKMCIVGACNEGCHYMDLGDYSCDCDRAWSEMHDWINKAEEALEKAEKYKWHDLRKNPDDLPDAWEYVLICTYKNEEYVAQVDTVLHTWVLRDDEFDYCEVGSSMVKAWREIDPFKEVEE